MCIQREITHHQHIAMPRLVKICGLQTVEAAEKALDSGADLLGVIMVPNRKRTVDIAVARLIAEKARQKRLNLNRPHISAEELIEKMSHESFSSPIEYFEKFHRATIQNGPFLVGVFRNQKIDDVLRLADEASLDFIQLHGDEDPADYIGRTKYGIIKRFVIPDQVHDMTLFFPTLQTAPTKNFILPLLDSEAGGEGEAIDWTLLNDLEGKFILAGGLTPHNLHSTKPYLKNVVGFDVSSGTENASGTKDPDLIEQFVITGKSI